ncbi:hypothetical protein JOJ86_005903 [Rhodococcus percolatus]|uniref:hypothetical protein n=1 Tax=Rhodococcus opacus TaxID=37919 RepID=UPI001AE7063C|nr:hypothetical protein [Rhodococcus opacus]MBP2208177.1 hypothetical protein [Rhodococcus opacus]
MKPSIGRIVHYTLSEQDAEAINKRRSDFQKHLKSEGYGDTGYIAHYGNDARAGDVYPALIVRVWDGDLVNLSVQLDGTDTYWATSRHEGVGLHNHWVWPPRA